MAFFLSFGAFCGAISFLSGVLPKSHICIALYMSFSHTHSDMSHVSCTHCKLTDTRKKKKQYPIAQLPAGFDFAVPPLTSCEVGTDALNPLASSSRKLAVAFCTSNSQSNA